MEITCVQMDVLISFYIDGDLSASLREKVEEHLKFCPTCRAKYNILSTLFDNMKSSLEDDDEEENFAESYVASLYPTREYKSFKNNLSAYMDNELPPEDSIKMKKYTIKNKNARKELENNYNIRKLMNDSFRKTRAGMKKDFSKNVMKQIKTNDKSILDFNPLIKVAASFVMTVLLLSAIIVFALSMS